MKDQNIKNSIADQKTTQELPKKDLTKNQKIGLRRILGLKLGFVGLVAIYFARNSPLIMVCIIVLMFIFGKMHGGSQTPLMYTLFGIFKPDMSVKGYVKPGFEKLEQEFQNNFHNGMERSSSLVAYVKGEKVIDVFGSYNETDNYDEDSLTATFSCGKSVMCLVMAMLVDRGVLDYDQKVCHYWPQFTGHGKENKTVADILQHEGGLHKLGDKVPIKHTTISAIKSNSIGEIIEKEPLVHHKKSQRSYHGIAIGFILNEIVRRADPKGRTMGEFIQEELAEPMGIDYYLGVPDEKLHKISKVHLTFETNKLWGYLQSFVPKSWGRKVNFSPIKYFKLQQYAISLIMGNTEYNHNSREFQQREMPSANAHSNAKSLSKIAAMIANDGVFEGKRYISKETLDLAHSNPIIRYDTEFMKTTKLTKGGWYQFSADQQYMVRFERSGFLGQTGLGGSYINWHKEDNIGFSYTMNLGEADLVNQRGMKLRKILKECVDKQK